MSKEPLDWRIPRVRLGPGLGAGEALTYVDASSSAASPYPYVTSSQAVVFPSYTNILQPRPPANQPAAPAYSAAPVVKVNVVSAPSTQQAQDDLHAARVAFAKAQWALKTGRDWDTDRRLAEEGKYAESLPRTLTKTQVETIYRIARKHLFQASLQHEWAQKLERESAAQHERSMKGLAAGENQYADTAGAGGVTPQPVTPYRPQPVVFTATPQFPNYLNVAPPPPEPEVFVRRVPTVNVNIAPTPRTNVTAEQDAALEAEALDLIRASEYAKASRAAKAASASAARYPGAIVVNSYAEFIAAQQTHPGVKIVKAAQPGFLAERGVSVAYDVLESAARRTDASGRVAEDFGAGTKSISNAAETGANALLDWIGMSKATAQEAKASALSWEDQAKGLVAPVTQALATQITGALVQSSLITSKDVDKCKSPWGQFTTSSGDRLIQLALKKTGILRALGAAATSAGFINKIKSDASLLARYSDLLPAIQATMDPALMSADNTDEASKRDVLNRAASAINTVITSEAALQAQPATPASAPVNVVVQRPAAPVIPAKTKPARRYGPESYDLPE